MKAEELVTRQFKEAQVAWKAEKNKLQARIQELELLAVGKAIGSIAGTAAEKASKPRILEPGLKKVKGDPEEKAASEDRREKAQADIEARVERAAAEKGAKKGK